MSPNLERCIQKFNSFKESSHPSSRMNRDRKQVNISNLIKNMAIKKVMQMPKPKLTIGSSSKKAILQREIKQRAKADYNRSEVGLKIHNLKHQISLLQMHVNNNERSV